MSTTLIVEYINGEQLIENIRTANINSRKLIYYRNDYYTGVGHSISLKDVSYVKIISGCVEHCIYESTKTV